MNLISAGYISLNSTFNRTFDTASCFYRENQAKNQLCMWLWSIRPKGMDKPHRKRQIWNGFSWGNVPYSLLNFIAEGRFILFSRFNIFTTLSSSKRIYNLSKVNGRRNRFKSIYFRFKNLFGQSFFLRQEPFSYLFQIWKFYSKRFFTLELRGMRWKLIKFLLFCYFNYLAIYRSPANTVY